MHVGYTDICQQRVPVPSQVDLWVVVNGPALVEADQLPGAWILSPKLTGAWCTVDHNMAEPNICRAGATSK